MPPIARTNGRDAAAGRAACGAAVQAYVARSRRRPGGRLRRGLRRGRRKRSSALQNSMQEHTQTTRPHSPCAQRACRRRADRAMPPSVEGYRARRTHGHAQTRVKSARYAKAAARKTKGPPKMPIVAHDASTYRQSRRRKVATAINPIPMPWPRAGRAAQRRRPNLSESRPAQPATTSRNSKTVASHVHVMSIAISSLDAPDDRVRRQRTGRMEA